MPAFLTHAPVPNARALTPFTKPPAQVKRLELSRRFLLTSTRALSEEEKRGFAALVRPLAPAHA